MSEISGKVGRHELHWKTAPHGASGVAQLQVGPAGKPVEVRWRRDPDGIWIELPHGTFGFDITAELDEQDQRVYSVRQRMSAARWSGIAFRRAGEQSATEGASGAKKAVRIRAQMPGKIIRVLVKPGQSVEKDQPLLVMEAMKMENEIRAPGAGKLSQVKVNEGQAVETGADLCLME